MIKNSKNVVTGSIDAGGNVTVGDTFVINLKEAADYKALVAALARLDQQMEKTRERITRFAADKDLKEEYEVELLDISKERNEKQQELDTLTRNVLKLAEEFCNLPLNTQRLEQAGKHFQAGEFDKARAVLDAEKMGNELDDAIRKEELGQSLQSQGKEERTKLANEYLILARLTAIDLSLADRFEKTKLHFEQSLKAERNVDNLFGYAYFLQEHKQFSLVQPLYKDVLILYRVLAQDKPQAYLPDVAATLNNLGILLVNKNEYGKARQAFWEALEQYRALAQDNPQTYLPDVAMTLNNLGVLLVDKNEYGKAEQAYQEALEQYRALAQDNPQTYQPDVARTLNNLGILLSDKNEYGKAEQAYQETLEIRRTLVRDNPQTYLPSIAATLNNLGNLLRDKNEYGKAEQAYQEALEQYRALAQDNLQTYLPDMAMTINNLGNLLRDKNEYGKAEQAYQEALEQYRALAQDNPQTHLPYVAATLNNLGVLLQDKNEYGKAEQAYQEALEIRRTLARDNPQTYLPYVAMTASNVSIFYCKSVPHKAQSLTYAEEGVRAALPFVEAVPAAKKYALTALQVVQAWGEDPQAFLQKILDQLNNTQP